jgi:hypothetical protein
VKPARWPVLLVTLSLAAGGCGSAASSTTVQQSPGGAAVSSTRASTAATSSSVASAPPAAHVSTLPAVHQPTQPGGGWPTDAGVQRAVELDINPEWVAGYLYVHHGSGPVAVPVVPGQTGIPGALLSPYSRDFFTVLSR